MTECDGRNSHISSKLHMFYIKVKFTPVQALRLCTGFTAHKGSRGMALLFHDHGTRRGWGVSVTPWPLFIRWKTRYPLYRMLGGPQGRSGQVRKISPPLGFDYRTVQLLASIWSIYLPIMIDTLLLRPSLHFNTLHPTTLHYPLIWLHSFSSLSYDRSKASSKASSPHSAI
jgi:hypothetical protein